MLDGCKEEEEEALRSSGLGFITVISQTVMMSLVQTFFLFLDTTFTIVSLNRFIKSDMLPLVSSAEFGGG